MTVLFQVMGWLGQACFALRTLKQWLASERAGRSVVPAHYWTLSLSGSCLLLGYTLWRNDWVFLSGTLVNTFFFVRNFALTRSRRDAGFTGARLFIALAFAILAIVAALSAKLHSGAFADGDPLWRAIGFTGQSIWLSRYAIQWWLSERVGRSVLPSAFWSVSVIGSVLLFAYACSQRDGVFIAAYALNPIPYLRNLILIHRPRPAGAA